MTLRRQLMFIILLTLTLPWAGCEYARELEITLRDNQINTLMEIAHSASQQLSTQMDQAAQGKVSVYATELKSPAILDGYADEWQAVDAHSFSVQPRSKNKHKKEILVRAGIFHRRLYLFFSIPDGSINYYNPTLAKDNGDRLYLKLWGPDQTSKHVQLTTSAPGAVNVRGDEQLTANIEGSWQETATGFSIEITMPIDIFTGEVQFVYTDADATNVETHYALPRGKVIIPNSQIKNTLQIYSQPTRDLYVINTGAWVLAHIAPNHANHFPDHQDSYSSQGEDEASSLQKIFDGLVTQFYRLILSDNSFNKTANIGPNKGRLTQSFIDPLLSGEPMGHWQQHRLSEAIITAGFPIFDQLNPSKTIGAVILEQKSEAILSVENQAISRLFRLSFAAIAMITLALLVFSGILSMRINQLSKAAKQVLSADGKFSATINTSSMQDEIGDLNRSLVTLQNRLGEYTHYLKTLASKLSHELRTPLAIVRSSLENLEQCENMDEKSNIYLQRANEGLDRLRYIVIAMSAATRVEQSISNAETEVIVLNDNLRSLVESYKQNAKHHTLTVSLPESSISIMGNSELIAQMLDKLFENALEFTPMGKTIHFALEKDGDQALLTVSNDGPLLPDVMQQHLFDSLVSFRDTSEDKAHLGLGLHIVKLIAEFHGGNVYAKNRENNSGVIFTIKLPCYMTA